MYFSMSLLVTKTLNKIVDVAKIQIVPVVKLGNLNAPTNILCCKIGSLPMTYLGKPFGAPFQAISIWDPIIEKKERKLSLWKHLYSSKGGRLTLLKNTLSYYLGSTGAFRDSGAGVGAGAGLGNF